MDELFENPRCELIYNKDYELLIATVLSAQCKDKVVNIVTKKLFSKYNIFTLTTCSLKEIEDIIKPVGSYTKKAYYVKCIANSLVKDYNGIVPNNRNYLESLCGVGRKTCNVVLANLFNEPTIAVDTHVSRISKRLKIANYDDSVWQIEQKLMHFFPKKSWSRLHHQLVLFGRYKCKSIKPICDDCKLKKYCLYYKNKKDNT
jgi:endonuclease-3